MSNWGLEANTRYRGRPYILHKIVDRKSSAILVARDKRRNGHFAYIKKAPIRPAKGKVYYGVYVCYR